MFLDNKYSKWYRAIVSQAQADVNNRTAGRFENHHILPRSMGGSNDPVNLVRLTSREHFICHLLLTRMVEGRNLYKMVAALNFMMNSANKRLDKARVTNRHYDATRMWSRVQFSEEHRRKISEAAKRRDPATRKQSAEANAKRSEFMKANPKTPEQIAKIAASQRGKNRVSWGSHSEEAKAAISAVHAGKPKSDEHRRKIAEAQNGKKRGPMSEEHRAKIGAANKGKTKMLTLSPEERQRRSEAMKRMRACSRPSIDAISTPSSTNGCGAKLERAEAG